MNLNHLKKFAQGARRKLMAEVAARLDYLLGHDDAYIRANEAHVTEIRRRLAEKGREQLVEEVAYTWFNRIVALRFMDLRGYNKVRIVSPQTGQVQPELLYQIKQGRTPKALHSLQETFDAYLTGRIRTDQPDREIYTAALLGMCNDYTGTLPFLFRRVDEYMAVLLPTDLLSENSILADVQNAIAEEEVKDVEVIGWLYQFYISEKKDQVFARPKGEKIKKEDIPAATQLFTPHWIVRYMVENSLGRLWRNNFPDTRVSEQMDYYIEGDPEPDYLEISGPEEITLLDPACGSGHILTYAFDLLYAMYEEAGYTPSEIPSLILQNNLYGIDIDTRAAELAAFALTMKARERDRFFFQRGVEPNVIAMEDVEVDPGELAAVASAELCDHIAYLSKATNIGSLRPVPWNLQEEIRKLRGDSNSTVREDLFGNERAGRIGTALSELRVLATQYHLVVTNPPYMQSSNANSALVQFLTAEFPEARADLFAAFIRRAFLFVASGGMVAMITQQSWMFLPAYEQLRRRLLTEGPIITLLHLGPRAFDTVSGEVVQTVSWVARNREGVTGTSESFRTTIIRTVEGRSETEKRRLFLEKKNVFRVDPSEFTNLPQSVFAYWASPALLGVFSRGQPLSSITIPRQGIKTGNNEKFLRQWFEVSLDRIALRGWEDKASSKRWIPTTKGGSHRRWYGNHEFVLDWEDNGARIRNYVDNDGKLLSRPQNTDHFFRRGITWSTASSHDLGVRYLPAGFGFESKGSAAFVSDPGRCASLLLTLNSIVISKLMNAVAPALNYSEGMIGSLPIVGPINSTNHTRARAFVSLTKSEWDTREVSWSFRRSPLLYDYRTLPEQDAVDEYFTEAVWPSGVRTLHRLADAYSSYTAHWTEQFKELHRLEEENNRIFIDLYGLQDELSPDVPYSEVTILQDELDKDARERGEIVFNKKEVLRQFVSYGVGCIFGRYSLDEDGLILANAGDTIDTYLERIPDPRLRPDESGILPITEDDDFPDDLPSQFRAFLRAAFGTEQYDENVQFLEEGLGRDLRSYFLKEFYKDHVKRYKKRPIYWLITSPKGSLRALIYLHRYNRDTVNRFLNDYLRPYQRKLEARRRTAEQSLNTGGLSGSERTKARKDIDRISAALDELLVWQRDIVRPLAEQQVELDLDDGVKVNYGKLGAILETVKGLNG